MLNLYLVSIIISIMIITIVSFTSHRTSTRTDFTLLFIVKLYFTLIPVFNLIISFIILYTYVKQLLEPNSLKKD